MFGFSIGINVTTVVFLGTPPPVGFGYSAFAIAGFYGTPIVRCPSYLNVRTTKITSQVAVLVGEFIGRFTNDWIMNLSIQRNNGVFEAESRLWWVI